LFIIIGVLIECTHTIWSTSSRKIKDQSKGVNMLCSNQCTKIKNPQRLILLIANRHIGRVLCSFYLLLLCFFHRLLFLGLLQVHYWSIYYLFIWITVIWYVKNSLSCLDSIRRNVQKILELFKHSMFFVILNLVVMWLLFHITSRF